MSDLEPRAHLLLGMIAARQRRPEEALQSLFADAKSGDLANDGTSVAEGTVLDHSTILFGSNMSNSNAHDHFPLPAVVLGGGAGRLRGNQHLRYPDRTPVANLMLTVLNRAGVPIETLGDSTGSFAEV